jgi:hypothetical protein
MADDQNSNSYRAIDQNIMSADNQLTTGRCSTEPAISTPLFLMHLLWLFFGPLGLMALLQGIGHSAMGFGPLDCAYFALAGIMIFARWFDQRSGQCMTVAGERSTWKQFRQFAFGLSAAAVTIWIIAKLSSGSLVGGG